MKNNANKSRNISIIADIIENKNIDVNIDYLKRKVDIF